MAGTSLVALRWTLSRLSLSLLVLGDHITEAYSRWGRTRDLNRSVSDCASRFLNVCLMQPNTLFALDTCVLMCCENVSLLSMMTPRSFSSDVVAIVWREPVVSFHVVRVLWVLVSQVQCFTFVWVELHLHLV